MVRRAGMDGALLGAIDRQSRVAPQAYEILREAIISMRLRPGVALSENEIAKQIGTSRTPVREAFIRLADEGHVVVVPQLGTFVAPIDLAEVVEAVFIRENLESAAAIDCIPRMNPHLAGRIDSVLERQRHAVERADQAAFLETDASFHRLLFEAGGHRRAWSVVELARRHLDKVRILQLQTWADGSDPSAPEGASLAGAMAQHRRIFAAVQSGDAERVRSEMRRHVESPLSAAPLLAARLPELFDTTRFDQLRNETADLGTPDDMDAVAARVTR